MESEKEVNPPLKKFPFPMRHSLSSNFLFQKIQSNKKNSNLISDSLDLVTDSVSSNVNGSWILKKSDITFN
jgi:hypothetical protein